MQFLRGKAEDQFLQILIQELKVQYMPGKKFAREIEDFRRRAGWQIVREKLLGI
jgi:parvulin-like peptidyl-prolyl isomerase